MLLTQSTGPFKSDYAFPQFLSFSRGMKPRDEKVRNSILGHTKVLLWDGIPRFCLGRCGSTTNLLSPHTGSTTIYYHRLDRKVWAKHAPILFSHFHSDATQIPLRSLLRALTGTGENLRRSLCRYPTDACSNGNCALHAGYVGRAVL